MIGNVAVLQVTVVVVVVFVVVQLKVEAVENLIYVGYCCMPIYISVCSSQ